MNSTHREVVMKDNHELMPVTADTQDLIQYYTTEENQLVGLGVRMDLGVDFTGEGTIHAEVYDVTEAAASGEEADLSSPGNAALRGGYRWGRAAGRPVYGPDFRQVPDG